MAFVPVADSCYVELKYTAGDAFAENTLWFRGATDNVNLSTMQELMDAMEIWVADHLAPLQSTACSLTEIAIRDMTEENGLILSETFTVAGELASAIMPGNVTGYMTFRSGRAGRSFRGGNYVIGLGENQITGNSLLQQVVDDYTTAYEALETVLAATDWTHVIVSRISNGVPRANGLTTAVVSYVMNTGVDSQKRRLLGRGQ